VSEPLTGTRVVEFAAFGPAPFAATMLADAGAEVLRLSRPGVADDPVQRGGGFLGRGRPSIEVDLKSRQGRDRALELVSRADVLLEGHRPGVMERLGLGPDVCLTANPRLVYARMTGWGQDGPRAAQAGHDINYLAVSGALRAVARAGEPPVPPLNLVADFGGGGMLLAYGVLAALLERARSGRGQVVDAAMLDGVNLLMCGVWSRIGNGAWNPEPGTNEIDTGSHYYNVYRTADGEYMAVGSVEPRFYRRLLDGLGLDRTTLPDQHDSTSWPWLRELISERFATRTQAEWIAVFDDLDACVTPVLGVDRAPGDPQMVARGLLPDVDGARQPAPAPRFGRSPLRRPDAPSPSADELLRRWTVADGAGRTAV
jgi:alpha-methylacyl-CoA racemase